MTRSQMRHRIKLAHDYRNAAGDVGRSELVLTGQRSVLNNRTWRWMDNYGMALARAVAAVDREVGR